MKHWRGLNSGVKRGKASGQLSLKANAQRRNGNTENENVSAENRRKFEQ